MIRARMAGLTPGFPFRARETVEVVVPTARAMSLRVTPRLDRTAPTFAKTFAQFDEALYNKIRYLVKFVSSTVCVKSPRDAHAVRGDPHHRAPRGRPPGPGVEPWRVIARTREPILEPEEPYEVEGDVPNVVFPEGAAVMGEDLWVFYGGADKVCCVAKATLEALLDCLLSAGRVWDRGRPGSARGPRGTPGRRRGPSGRCTAGGRRGSANGGGPPSRDRGRRR
ncbi:MAG: hypothetical protein GXO72_00805 [Caldiserica bacterium]|nr:hypothetical protein [Caldisericota bacterium]